MKLSDKIYVYSYIEQEQNGSMNPFAVTAILLTSCPSSRLREGDIHGYPIPFISKQIDLINSLHQLDTNVTYGIRFISDPNPDSFSGSKIDTCIFCKIADETQAKAQIKIEEQTEHLLIQLCGTLPDYEWQAVKDPKIFRKLWKPLEWEKADVIDIRQREELVSLDSIIPTRKIGFAISPTNHEKSNNPVYFVHPFLPHMGQLERFLRIMLLYSSPIVFTIILKPVQLTPDEEQALLDGLSLSEGFYPENSSSFQRIQQQRAHMVN